MKRTRLGKVPGSVRRSHGCTYRSEANWLTGERGSHRRDMRVQLQELAILEFAHPRCYGFPFAQFDVNGFEDGRGDGASIKRIAGWPYRPKRT